MDRGRFYAGVMLVLLGALILVSNLLGFDFWRLFWPLLLIVMGIFIIVRPDLTDFAGPVSQRFLGDIDRRGEWTVQDEAFTAFVGDVDLDMSQAHIPAGETVLKFSGFVGDVTIRVPGDVGVAVQANAVVSELRLDDEKEENFLSPTRGKSANYKLAERRLRVEASYFVCDVRVVYT